MWKSCLAVPIEPIFIFYDVQRILNGVLFHHWFSAGKVTFCFIFPIYSWSNMTFGLYFYSMSVYIPFLLLKEEWMVECGTHVTTISINSKFRFGWGFVKKDNKKDLKCCAKKNESNQKTDSNVYSDKVKALGLLVALFFFKHLSLTSYPTSHQVISTTTVSSRPKKVFICKVLNWK